MIELTESPIDVPAVIAGVGAPAAGAVVVFLGVVREMTEGRQTESLEYEAHAPMAHRVLTELETEARRRWPLEGCAVVHRLGKLAVGQVSVLIAVSAAHRQPAFEAAQWLIDQIKQVVPIWKREHWADGTSQWVHPGLDPAAAHGGQECLPSSTQET
jgi:molybdopterin synthase catalytic subunit